MEERRAEILTQIKKLQQEYKCLGYKTADGVPLEIGMKVFAISDSGVEEITLTDGCSFDDFSLNEPKSDELFYLYDELLVDKQKGIDKQLRWHEGRAKQLMQDALKAQADLEKVRKVYN